MLDRVVMDVIGIAFQLRVIPDHALVEAPLPDRRFAAAAARCGANEIIVQATAGP